MTSDLLHGLLTANLALSVAILVAASLRAPVRRRFGPRMAYGLWLAPPLAMLAVLLPRPAWMPDGLLAMTGLLRAATGQAAATAMGAGAGQAPAAMSLIDLLGLLWLVGAAVAAGLTLWAHRRGVASFGRLSPSGGVLRATRNGLGPAMIGIWRPRLVLPADFEARFSDREQALILAHEHHHKFSGDTRINGLVSLVCCLNWFNPLVHIAAHLLRVDQELACDAAVVERFPGERRTYAEALLKSQLAPAPLPLGCTWPSGSQNLLQERLTMLAHKSLARPYQLAGGAFVGALCLGAAAAAWAASGVTQKSAPEVVVTSAPIAQADQSVRTEADATVIVASPPARRATPVAETRSEAVQNIRVVADEAAPSLSNVCLSNSCSQPAPTPSPAPVASQAVIEVVGRPLSGITGTENVRIRFLPDEAAKNSAVEVQGISVSFEKQTSPSSVRNIVSVQPEN